MFARCLKRIPFALLKCSSRPALRHFSCNLQKVPLNELKKVPLNDVKAVLNKGTVWEARPRKSLDGLTTAQSGLTIAKSGLTTAVLDWSGTCVDKWVMSVAWAFVDLWKRYGIEITMDEARKPMGLSKALHNAEIAKMPRIEAAWRAIYDRDILPEDLHQMFIEFIPIQSQILERPDVYELIPGTVNAVNFMRQTQNMRIGVTTGFQRTFVNRLLRSSAKQGFIPDFAVAADDKCILRPRPFPDMMWANMLGLQASSAKSVLKVDDTRGGIGEGRAASCWTCGISRTSVYMNIDSLEHYNSLSFLQVEARNQESRQILLDAGAHFVIDTIHDLPQVVHLVNKRLADGHSP